MRIGPRPAFALWDVHAPALAAFLAIAGQWRVAAAGMGGVIWLGLDYAAAEAGLRLAGIGIDAATWEDVRVIEAGAVAEMNRKR